MRGDDDAAAADVFQGQPAADGFKGVICIYEGGWHKYIHFSYWPVSDGFCDYVVKSWWVREVLDLNYIYIGVVIFGRDNVLKARVK